MNIEVNIEVNFEVNIEFNIEMNIEFNIKRNTEVNIEINIILIEYAFSATIHKTYSWLHSSTYIIPNVYLFWDGRVSFVRFH